MAGMNLWLTPIFMSTPREAVVQMMLPVIVPFNLLKAGANAAVTLLVYKRISRLIHKELDR
jgi:riboflavin transporter FmnP